MSPRFSCEEKSTQRIESLQLSTSVADNALVDSVIDSFAVNEHVSDSEPEENSAHSTKNMPLDIMSACYAATVATGGVIGYLKAGSVPSLMAGLVFGGILGVGTFMTSQNPDHYHLTLGTSTALMGLMGYRFYNSGKFMPAGLIAALSAGMVLRISLQLYARAQKVNK